MSGSPISIGDSLSIQEIPDSIQPILAARRWEVRQDGGLDSAVVPTYRSWGLGKNIARCVSLHHTSGIPNKACHCGFYALNRTYALPYATTTSIRGTVALSGKVLVGEFGYRAEKAEIHSLKVNLFTIWKPSVRKAAKYYGVPLRFFWPKLTETPEAKLKRSRRWLRRGLVAISLLMYLTGLILSLAVHGFFLPGFLLEIFGIILFPVRKFFP